VSVPLRRWRQDSGPVETSTLFLSRRTRLPYWFWRLLLRTGTVVEVLAEFDDPATQRGKLVAYLGPRWDTELREAHSGWLGKRTLEHPRFGRFTFDERLDWFETKTDWLGRTVSLSIGIGADGSADAEPAARVFEQAAEWDAHARDLAAAELLATKNEHWLGDDEEPLSPQDFKTHMTLESIGFNPGPYIQFFFEDGDLFAGHTIIVTFDEEEGQAWAEFAG
jgi:hypothetical protein